MIFARTQLAPEGSTWARHAFDPFLGELLPLTVEGETVGEATLIGAVPYHEYREVLLTWRIEGLRADRQNIDEFAFDAFIPPDPFNPAAAIAKVERALRG